MSSYEIAYRVPPATTIYKQVYIAASYELAQHGFRRQYPGADFVYCIRVHVPVPPDRRLPREDD